MHAALAALVLGGSAAGSWLLVSHFAGRSEKPTGIAPAAAEHSTALPASTPAQSATPSPSTAPSPSPSPPQSVGTVTIAADAGQNPDVTTVGQFLNQYFGAINKHDYQSYRALLNPQAQQALTQTQFSQGYRSTSDSAETLASLSSADNGDLQADVTFTSHQNPADSADGTQSCTDWAISLWLTPNGASYVIDQPPSGYHASSQAC